MERIVEIKPEEETGKVKASVRKRKRSPKPPKSKAESSREWRLKLTPEKRAQMRASARRRHAQLEPEERERRTARERERYRKNQEEATAEELELAKQKKREQNRRYKENLRKLLKEGDPSDPAVQKALERKQRKAFQDLQKRLLMSEEEKQRLNVEKYFRMEAWKAKRGKFADQPEEFKKKRYQMHKDWIKSLNPEARQRHDETVRRAQFRWWSKRVGEDPNTTDKTLHQLQKMYWDKVKVEDPEKWESHHKKRHYKYKERYYVTMTPEQRERRKHQMKVNAAKRKLRNQLENEGTLDAQEIEARLKAVQEEMWLVFDPNWTWESYGTRKTTRRYTNRITECEPPSPEENCDVQNQEESPYTEESQRTLVPESCNFFCMCCFPVRDIQSSEYPFGFPSKLELLVHVQDKHPTRYFPCQDCFLLKYSQETLQLHRKMCEANPKCKG